MKNITLSADESLLEQARHIAHSRHKTFNAEFREWLVTYTAQNSPAEAYDIVMNRLAHIDSGGTYSRDEMNER